MVNPMTIYKLEASAGQIDRKHYDKNHRVTIIVEFSEEEKGMARKMLHNLSNDLLEELRSKVDDEEST